MNPLVDVYSLALDVSPQVFPLHITNFPSSASDLERLLNQSLKRIFAVETDPVRLDDVSYPHLKEMRILLDGARLRSNLPGPPVIRGEISPALRVDQLSLSAVALSLGPATLDLSLLASAVDFTQGKDADEQIVLALENAADGKVEIFLTQTSLATFITTLLQNQAKKQGIIIDAAELDLRAESSRSVAVRVRLRIRKIFLSASLAVTGQLDLDDGLNVKISRLQCVGNGAIATLACGILNPYLRRTDGREFSLMSLPTGKMQLRDVQLAVDENVRVTAEFGSRTNA